MSKRLNDSVFVKKRLLVRSMKMDWKQAILSDFYKNEISTDFNVIQIENELLSGYSFFVQFSKNVSRKVIYLDPDIISYLGITEGEEYSFVFRHVFHRAKKVKVSIFGDFDLIGLANYLAQSLLNKPFSRSDIYFNRDFKIHMQIIEISSDENDNSSIDKTYWIDKSTEITFESEDILNFNNLIYYYRRLVDTLIKKNKTLLKETLELQGSLTELITLSFILGKKLGEKKIDKASTIAIFKREIEKMKLGNSVKKQILSILDHLD